MKTRIITLLLLFMPVICEAQQQSFGVKKIHFQMDVELSAVFTSKTVYNYSYSSSYSLDNVYYSPSSYHMRLIGPTIDIIAGARCTKYFFFGGGVGYHTLLTKYKGIRDFNHYMPIYGNAKFYIPVNINFLPYYELSLGGFVGFNEIAKDTYGNESKQKLKNGLFFRTGFGFDIKRVNIGIGYELLHNRVYNQSNNEHIGFLKLGYRFF